MYIICIGTLLGQELCSNRKARILKEEFKIAAHVKLFCSVMSNSQYNFRFNGFCIHRLNVCYQSLFSENDSYQANIEAIHLTECYEVYSPTAPAITKGLCSAPVLI